MGTPRRVRVYAPQTAIRIWVTTNVYERPRDEIALGLVGKFWRPVIPFAKVSRDEFCDFSEPGYAKTVYSLSVRKHDDRRTLLSGVMRTATTDDQARKWFRRYRALGVGSGAHILVSGLLDVTREIAEKAMALAAAKLGVKSKFIAKEEARTDES